MIKRLLLKNWLSHKHTEIEFSPGKNLIIGYNGAGKTSIVEGIYFGLFGDTKGSYRESLDRAKLIHHGESRAELILEFHDYRVVRMLTKQKKGTKTEASLYKGGKLIAEGPDRVNQLILEILGMDKEVFSHILYGGQEMISSFLRESPREQKEMLDKAFNIHKLKDYLEHTKKLLSELDKLLARPVDIKELHSLKEKLEKAREELSSLREKHEQLKKRKSMLEQELDKSYVTLTRYKSLKEKWESLQRRKTKIEGELRGYGDIQEVKEDKLSSLLNQIRSLQTHISKKENEIKKIQDKLSYHRSLLKLLEQTKMSQQQIEQQLKNLRIPPEPELVDLSPLEKELGRIENEYNQLRSQLDKVKLSEGKSVCPVCGRPLDPEHISRLRQEIIQKLKSLKELHQQKIQEYNNLYKKKKEAEKMIIHRERLLEKKKQLENQLTEYKKSLEQTISQIKEINAQNLEQLQKEIEDELASLRSKLTSLEIELKKLQEMKARWERKLYLEKTLKEVQEELSSLSFDEKSYEKVLESYHAKKASLSSIIRELNTLSQSLNAVNSLYKELNNQYNALMEEYERQQAFSDLKKELLLIKEGLELGQKEVREDIVSLINDYLPEVWEVLSPNRYYQNPHLSYEYVNKVVGHAYRFYIESPRGLLEASMLSGGEKTLYMLSLKLTLVKLLSKHSILILDEPTQSLDENAVKALAEAISQLTENEVGQFIVITHNELLKESDWDRVIQVSKKGQGSYQYSVVEIY